jgi:UDP-N-acetylmuramoyl-tripeptide--D-alanyl-D-alanine ligase
MISYVNAARVRGRVLKVRGRTLIKKEILLPLYTHVMKWPAIMRRSTLRNTTFIGVTGSCGKTTAVNLISSVLSQAGSCQAKSLANYVHTTISNLLSLERSTKYCVQEISAHQSGDVVKHVRVFKPQIGVVTVIGNDHYKVHRGADGAAREKGALIESLPASGVAVLNADDPHVIAMAGRTAARVITYGLAADAEVRATEVSDTWPERLTLTVVYGGESVRLRTQLVGEHWVPSVLAAIACGIACGVDLQTGAKGVASSKPYFGRYSVHETEGGANYVLDSYKAPLWTIEAGLKFLKTAHAPRKTAVFGTISDYPGATSPRYRQVARGVLPLVDRVVFVGPGAGYVSGLCEGDARSKLFTFESAYEASAFFAKDIVAGELIYIKASGTADHLERIMLAQRDNVVCWRERCGRNMNCHRCKYYHTPSLPRFLAVGDTYASPEVASAS